MWRMAETFLAAKGGMDLPLEVEGDGDGDDGVLSKRVLDSDVSLFLQLAAEVGEEC